MLPFSTYIKYGGYIEVNSGEVTPSLPSLRETSGFESSGLWPVCIGFYSQFSPLCDVVSLTYQKILPYASADQEIKVSVLEKESQELMINFMANDGEYDLRIMPWYFVCLLYLVSNRMESLWILDATSTTIWKASHNDPVHTAVEKQ